MCIAELNAVVEASKEAVPLANLLREVGVDLEQSVNVFVDKQACIALCKNSESRKEKALRFKSALLSEFSQRLTIRAKLPTNHMPADTLTKALGRTKLAFSCDSPLGTNTT